MNEQEDIVTQVGRVFKRHYRESGSLLQAMQDTERETGQELTYDRGPLNGTPLRTVLNWAKEVDNKSKGA